MTIALDATRTQDRNPTGIGNYCINIIHSMVRLAPQQKFLLCYRSTRFLQGLASRRPGRNCSRYLLEKPFCVLIERKASVFHALNERLLCRFPRTVTTFQDLFTFSGNHASPEWSAHKKKLVRRAVEQSDHIVAVSQHTADQIVSYLGYPRAQISVIYHGVNPVSEFPQQDLQDFRRHNFLERPFLLYVGVLDRRKNIVRLVKAFEHANCDCDLVLAGFPGYGAEQIMKAIAESPARSRIRLLGYVSQPYLERLYRTAAAFVFPSFVEGFGLPVLEAMSAGLPVVTSNRSATAEISADAALLVDPQQTEEIQLALERVVSDTDCRRRLIQAGLKRVAEFSWEKAAASTLALYSNL